MKQIRIDFFHKLIFTIERHITKNLSTTNNIHINHSSICLRCVSFMFFLIW